MAETGFDRWWSEQEHIYIAQKKFIKAAYDAGGVEKDERIAELQDEVNNEKEVSCFRAGRVDELISELDARDPYAREPSAPTLHPASEPPEDTHHVIGLVFDGDGCVTRAYKAYYGENLGGWYKMREDIKKLYWEEADMFTHWMESPILPREQPKVEKPVIWRTQEQAQEAAKLPLVDCVWWSAAKYRDCAMATVDKLKIIPKDYLSTSYCPLCLCFYKIPGCDGCPAKLDTGCVDGLWVKANIAYSVMIDHSYTKESVAAFRSACTAMADKLGEIADGMESKVDEDEAAFRDWCKNQQGRLVINNKEVFIAGRKSMKIGREDND